MFLHIDDTFDIAIKNIIMILNIDIFNIECNREFLNNMSKSRFIQNEYNDSVKSVIIAEVNGNQEVYFSPISSTTLYKRANLLNYLNT